MLSNTQHHAGRAKRFETNSRALVVLPARAGRRSGTHHRADESEGRGCQRCHGNHSGMLLQRGIVVWWPRSPKLPIAAREPGESLVGRPRVEAGGETRLAAQRLQEMLIPQR